uniref:Uncharacterized protein n=1 Tax=Arundo donax TaxID=35708 RepID=A0A0A9H5E7_ARUDO
MCKQLVLPNQCLIQGLLMRETKVNTECSIFGFSSVSIDESRKPVLSSYST